MQLSLYFTGDLDAEISEELILATTFLSVKQAQAGKRSLANWNDLQHCREGRSRASVLVSRSRRLET